MGDHRPVNLPDLTVPGRGRSAVEEAEALLALTDVLSRASTDLRELLRTAAEAVARLCGDTVALWLTEGPPTDPVLRVRSWWHEDPRARADLAELGSTVRLPASADSFLWNVVDRGPMLLRHVSPDQLASSAHPAYLEYFRRWGLASMVLVPLRSRGGLLGVLGCSRDGGRASFDDADLAFIERIGAPLALALDNARLVADVRRELAERVEAEQALRHQATHDALTGLPNREALHEALDESLRAGRVAMLMMDLDGFKEINDAFGHAVGDDVLVLVARRLRAATPHGAVLARLGGDEFAVVVPGADVAAAEAVARGLRRTLDEPLAVAASRLAVSGSVGIATAAGPDAAAGTLLRQADTAMYRAKRTARRVAAYDPESDGWAAVQLPRIAEVRHALTAGELVLHWQPVVDVSTGRLHHVEALVRWVHPVRGLLGADEVVPLAEQGGLAEDLTAVVLDLALRQARAWGAAGHPVDVAVNVPPVVVALPGWTEQLLAALRAHGLAPGDVILEVTESTLATRAARQGLAELASAGVRLALDDFGTGWSSLARLRDLPLRQLKIDRSFVTGMVENAVDRALVRAVAALGRELGLQVIAEGVETAAVSRLLAELGVDLQQGWLHGHPSPARAHPADLGGSPR